MAKFDEETQTWDLGSPTHDALEFVAVSDPRGPSGQLPDLLSKAAQLDDEQRQLELSILHERIPRDINELAARVDAVEARYPGSQQR